MMDNLSDVVGLLGVGTVLCAYFLLQIGKISSDRPTYSFLNLIASSAVLFSLVYSWNLPAFLMESAWVLISAYGLWKATRGSHALG